MKGRRGQKTYHFTSTEDTKLAKNSQSFWDIEAYASKINVAIQSRKEHQAQKFLESTTKLIGKGYEVGRLWSGTETTLPNNYGSALGQLYSLEKIFPRDPKFKELCHSRLIQMLKMDSWRSSVNRKSKWILPHRPVLNPNKPGKHCRFCNAAANFKELCLSDKVVSRTWLISSIDRNSLWDFEKHQ